MHEYLRDGEVQSIKEIPRAPKGTKPRLQKSGRLLRRIPPVTSMRPKPSFTMEQFSNVQFQVCLLAHERCLPRLKKVTLNVIFMSNICGFTHYPKQMFSSLSSPVVFGLIFRYFADLRMRHFKK